MSRLIDTLDKQCVDLIVESTKTDDRDIIAKPNYREQVKVFTKQIESLDNQIVSYNESVPRQFSGGSQGNTEPSGAEMYSAATWARLSLTAPCLFIRGMNHNIDQNFGAALNDWKASLNAKGSPLVEVDANYWIGYINNTLGHFEQAPVYLKAAAKAAPDHRVTELKRLELETRFFALRSGEVPQSLLDEGRDLFNELTAHRVSKRAISSFATTMGNMSLVQNVRSAPAGEAIASEESVKWFERAISAAPRSRWARFGIAQNIILSGETLSQGHRTEVEDVIESVNREFQNRAEYRSKVLSKVTEYICIVMLGGDEKRLSIIGGLIEQLTSDVIARTIYSQFRKQNVSKEDFLKEFLFLQDTSDVRQAFIMANKVA